MLESPGCGTEHELNAKGQHLTCWMHDPETGMHWDAIQQVLWIDRPPGETAPGSVKRAGVPS